MGWQKVARPGLVALVLLGVGTAPVLAGQEGGSGSIGIDDIVQNDDVIVEGSVCASFDDACVDGEGFIGPGGLAVELKFQDSVPNMWFADTTNLDWVIGHGPSSDDFQIFNDTGQTKFRIQQGAADNLLQLTSQGVGIGTDAPNRPLHVVGAPANQSVVKATNTDASDALRTVFSIENFGPPSFTLIDTSPDGADWFFRSSQTGQFAIASNASAATAMTLTPGGNMTIAGSLTQSSSRSVKHDIAEVDADAILAAVRDLDISTWTYNGEPGVTHMGPMAEDFWNAFGLGHTSKGIAAVDADGVALAAIKALADENAELAAENAELGARLAALDARLAALEAAARA